MFLCNEKFAPVQIFFNDDSYTPYITQPGAHTLKTLSHLNNNYRSKGVKSVQKQLRITNKCLH